MKRNLRISSIGYAVVAASLLSGAAPGHAEGLSFGVDAGVGESDNITLVPANRVSQTLAIADLDFSLKGHGARLVEDVTGDFTYLDFLQHAYDRQLLGRLSGDLSYALVPGALTWTFQDNWGQAQVDPVQTLVPTNQQNVNYFSTGPEWYERLGGTEFMDVSVRYARVDYSATPIAGNRILGALQLGHDLSAQSNISLNGNFERILYDNTALNQDYDLSRVYGRYQLSGARSDLGLNLGVSLISGATHSNAGFFGEFQGSRKLSPGFTFHTTLGRALTDTSSSFNNLQTSAVAAGGGPAGGNSAVSSSPAPLTSSVYTSEYVTAGLEFFRNRTDVVLQSRLERDAYVTQPQYDGSRATIGITAERKLTHVLTAQAFGNYNRYSYDHENFTATSTGYVYQDGLYGVAVKLREGRGLEVRLRLDRATRDVSRGQGTNYTENRVFLTVGYRPEPLPESAPAAISGQ